MKIVDVPLFESFRWEFDKINSATRIYLEVFLYLGNYRNETYGSKSHERNLESHFGLINGHFNRMV